MRWTVVILMIKNNTFKLIFKNQNNQEIDCDYRLHDSIVADKWFKKIKHLKNITIDSIESELVDLNNLKNIYQEFCRFAEITPVDFQKINQNLLNHLHQIYEQLHGTLSKRKNNSVLYKFHHSIHFHESENNKELEKINVGWGVKEGPLTEHFYCNQYYEPALVKNNVYLPWAELGKTPLSYWKNAEPNNQARFNELSKPHITFRPKFFVATKNIKPTNLRDSFVDWFDHYKQSWFEHYNISKWNHIDEYSAPLLAVANHQEDLINCKFVRFEL